MITENQLAELKKKIYNLLMENPDMDMGDMNHCTEAAEILVYSWIKKQNIKVTP